MRNRALMGAFAALVFLAAAGCNSTVGPGLRPDGAQDVAPQPPKAGQTYLGGNLVLKNDIVLPATGGTGEAVSVVLDNTTSEILRDVVLIVIFYYPSGNELVSFETEGIQDYFKVSSQGEYSIPAVPTVPKELLGMSVDVSTGTGKLPPTVARERGMPGSKFMGGKLECVAMNDHYFSANPAVGFELRNISPEVVQFIEYKLVLRLRRNGKVVETDWEFDDREIPAGGTIELTPSIAGIERGLADYVLLVKGADL